MILPHMTRPLEEPIGIQNYPGSTFRCFTKGDTLPFRFTFIDDETDLPEDVTGWQVWVTFSDKLIESADDVTEQTKVAVQIPLQDLAEAIFEGDVTDSDTNSLPVGLVYAEAKFVTQGGAQHIIDMAVLEVYPGVSDTVL